jgi:ElaA protein
VEWIYRRFEELTLDQLYAVLRLRAEVFIVEQNCPYLDPDGYDPEAEHLLGMNDGVLVAYARIFAAGVKYAEASIGRVITSSAVRGTGAGRELMNIAVSHIDGPIRISAQEYLERFYGSFGFVRVAETYLEDGIPHVEMVRGV